MGLTISPTFTNKQKIALKYLFDKNTNEILYGGSAGGGKSFLGCAYLLMMSLKYPGTRHLMGRSKLDSLKKTTLNTFFEVCKLWGIESKTHYNYNAQSNIITFFNSSEIILKDMFAYPSDRNFDSLGSYELTSSFLDEANQITERAKMVLMSRLRYKLDEYNLTPTLLMTCNPSKGWLYTNYYKPAKEGTIRDNRVFIQSLVDDNKYISKHYKTNLESLDEISKQRLLYGNWEYDSTKDSLIHYDNIVGLFSNQGIEGDRYISADISRYGDDKTVICLWYGMHIDKIITINKSSLTEVADKIKELQREYDVYTRNIVIDEDGIGSGVVDMIKGCRGFINGSRCLNKENYQNLKTQCYYYMSDYINKGHVGISTNDIKVKNDIIQELEQVRSYNIDKDGKLQIIPKPQIKDIIGRSPDYADAIMMRFYFAIDANYGRYYVY